ncbi:MAG: BREX system ATP-binding domain-containing protein [Terriglobia bacterium]
MDTNPPINYKRALEALRNGVPNRDAVRVLGSNQVEVERSFQQQLAAVQSAGCEGKQAPGLLIAGDFGAGKSHLLDYFEHLALSENFVCSRIVISKETPLFDPAKVYLAAVDGAAVPGRSGQAIQEIALRLRPNTQKYAEFFQWANNPSSGLSPLFPATLLLHERLNNDPELVDQITSFWSGERLSISKLRQGMKQIGCAAMFSLRPVKVRELALQRFTFTPRLILGAGYNGWVLLIDEVELIGRYSLLQRARSYVELARWMGRIEGQAYPGLTAVAAITEDFGLKVLQEKSDRDTVGPRLRSKGGDEFIVLAGRAERGMRLIDREAVTLLKPDQSTLDHTYNRLKEIHGRAYGWDPPDIPPSTPSLTRRMRSYVRRWVNEWDLKRLYPGAEVLTEEEQEVRPSYELDEYLEQPSSDSEGSS